MESEAKKRRGKRSSSSQQHGSVEVTAVSHEEAAVLASVTVLASELRPEHKLPSRDILVQPKPKFMELLKTVGAKGMVFTARQVLSYLIKYITNRQLYVQQDPKRVYCGKDPLGEVFGIDTFTIKDAKKLLFDNMSVLREVPNFASQHNDSFQREQRKMYYTFHQAQQTTEVSRPISVPTRSATTPSLHSVPITTATLCQGATDHKSSSIKKKDGPEKYDSVIYQGKDVDDGASSSNFVNYGYAVSDSVVSSSCEGVPASSLFPHAGDGNGQTTAAGGLACTSGPSSSTPKIPVIPHEMPKNTSGQSASLTEGHSVMNTMFVRGTKRKRSRITSESSEECIQQTADSNRRSSQPWYCMRYHPSEDLKSLDSEVLSIQDCETAIVDDSSDDLWFVDEDEATLVEYDVPSDSSDDYNINKSNSDDGSSVSEHVYELVVQSEDYSDLREDFSYLADNSDEETTDTEISDLDKWECMECGTRNLPFKRYCCRCWALRNEWLPDNQRMTLKERLFNRPLRRSFSAPAGNVNPPTPPCQQPSQLAASENPTSPEVTGMLSQTQRSRRDLADGLQDATPADFPDMPDGKNNGEDEAGTGVGSSDDQGPSKRPCIVSDEQGESSQDTIIVAQDSQAPTGTTNSEDQTKGELEYIVYAQLDSSKREDSGIGLTQDTCSSKKIDTGSFFKRKGQTPQTTSGKSFSPRKRQRSASGSDLPVQSGLALAGLKTSQLSDPSILQVGMGVPIYSELAGKSDPGAGPSSSKPSGVTEHYNDLCIICYNRPKTASIIHGRLGHQVCCYPCAKKLHSRGKPCPVCRRPIQAVIKNYLL